MANSKCRWTCPEQWSEWSDWLAAGLHARHRWRLPLLVVGLLFARGRRTVTSWLRAVGVSDDFADYYYFLASLGRKTENVATRLLAFPRLPVPAFFRLPRGGERIGFAQPSSKIDLLTTLAAKRQKAGGR